MSKPLQWEPELWDIHKLRQIIAEHATRMTSQFSCNISSFGYHSKEECYEIISNLPRT